MKMTDNLFFKQPKKNEYEMYKYLKDTDIVCKIYELTKSIIIMDKYCYTVQYAIDNKFITIGQIQELVYNKIDDLHKLGIFHGDLHGNNIVINRTFDDARIIDFEFSSFIKNISGQEIIRYAKSFGEEDDIKNIMDALIHEREVWKI
jgi:RIO-like serine/threonine protein kinase